MANLPCIWTQGRIPDTSCSGSYLGDNPFYLEASVKAAFYSLLVGNYRLNPSHSLCFSSCHSLYFCLASLWRPSFPALSLSKSPTTSFEDKLPKPVSAQLLRRRKQTHNARTGRRPVNAGAMALALLPTTTAHGPTLVWSSHITWKLRTPQWLQMVFPEEFIQSTINTLALQFERIGEILSKSPSRTALPPMAPASIGMVYDNGIRTIWTARTA